MATEGKGKRAKLPPHVALDLKKQKQFNQNINKTKQKVSAGKDGPGVVYVSHLPWGFVEEPLKKFFSQFGSIQKLRVSRNMKTGNSRGYAYIQFSHTEVAKIVAETMNNYLMFDKLLKCKYLPEPHPMTFKSNSKILSVPSATQQAIKKRNKTKTEEALSKSKAKSLQKLKKAKEKLAELGIDYSVEVEGAVPSIEIKSEPESDGEDTSEAHTATSPGKRKSAGVVGTTSAAKTRRKSEPVDTDDVKIELDCETEQVTTPVQRRQTRQSLRKRTPSTQKLKKLKG